MTLLNLKSIDEVKDGIKQTGDLGCFVESAAKKSGSTNRVMVNYFHSVYNGFPGNKEISLGFWSKGQRKYCLEPLEKC